MATVAERQFKMLTKKKESLFSIIQELHDLSNSLDTGTNLDRFHTLYVSLESVRGELYKVMDEINVIGFEVDKNFEPNFQILKTVNELCCYIHRKAATALNPNSSPSTSSATVPDPKSLPALPRIELPEFSGNIRDWETFYSVFKSLIHDNIGLSDSDKMHYLIGRLKGSALTICTGIAPTGDNYNIIWTSLLDRYQNQRVLANSYLEQLMDFKPLHVESARNLHSFLETFDSAVSAIKKLNLPDIGDFVLSYIARSKLDSHTLKAFDSFKRDTDIPSYGDLIKFVKEQAKILHANQSSAVPMSKPRNNKTFLVSQNLSKENKTICIYCSNPGHYVGRCGKFKSLPANKRYEIVRDKNWCYNCLSDKHGVRSCTSERTCTQCSKKHHILLHWAKTVSTTTTDGITDRSLESVNPSTSSQDIQVQKGFFCTPLDDSKASTVLLSTVVVNVINSPVPNATARFILDSGSQMNLFTYDCCKKLGLKWNKYFSSVQGLGQNSQKVRGVTNVVISSRYDRDKVFSFKSLLVDQITDKLPKVCVKVENVLDLAEISLADESFDKPGSIDGIIGAELFSHVLKNNRIIGKSGSPVAVQTDFGYVVMGKAPIFNDEIPYVFATFHEDESIERLIEKFWEIEQVPQEKSLSPDDLACEKLFLDTVCKDATGRYEVALPFKYPAENLGNSKLNAHLRLLSLEKRFCRHPHLRTEYNKAMQDFIDQGHLTLVDPKDECELGYYIPHHPVFKPESSSTPVRIVLDASAPSSNDLSLNDLLFCGPKLQNNIFTVLINFRLFRIAFMGDIRQMYRQINLNRNHWRYQRILWRFSCEEKIKTYALTVVAFGVKSSPYLALRTIKQLLQDEGKHYSLATKHVDLGLYIDDFTCSIDSESEAMELYDQVVKLFKSGCFDLTKFATNSRRLLEMIPEEKRLRNVVSFKTDTKVLGMIWDPRLDILSFNINLPDEKCTKRIILSAVARCYDPIGLIAPFILYLKLLVKALWLLKLDWDADPPENIKKNWKRLRNEWGELENIKFPRFIAAQQNNPITLIGFSDACQDGYGAVIYLRTEGSGDTFVSLICAKSKVSSLKRMTIPRLELCAAYLLSKLLKNVIDVYSERVPISKVIALSDSTTVLSWLAASYVKDIFVSNRIIGIKENVPTAHWYHIEGKSNPADCLSRGLTPKQLSVHPLWRNGPPFLKMPLSEWPVDFVETAKVLQLSPKNEGLVNVTTVETSSLIDDLARYSSWLKILRITVWVLKFVKFLNVKNKMTFVSVSDLSRAEAILLLLIQRKHFQRDISMLQRNAECSSQLRKLRPFLLDGLLRVGGRLKNSSLSMAKKHPIILPSKEKLVECLVEYYHRIHLHTGPHLLEALLRQKYWIVNGQNLIRKVIFKCNHCFRLRPKSLTPLMADLPAQRVQQSKAFLHTGVDYFGPFSVVWSKRRGIRTEKAYACIFVCMAVKAIHLELVSSLSTMHFLQAFKRFLARRGPCQVLYSDRGTNFIGAKSILRELNSFISSSSFQTDIQSELVANGVEWKFNSPAAPHMGGLWEGNIRVVKNHLHRVMGDQVLTYEELTTLLTQVEALLNSRPLCRLSADASAPEALTPAHFLTLTPLHSLPAENLRSVELKRLDRFQLIDKMVQDFWSRWRIEYLHSLQIRTKWDTDSPSIKEGTVVVLKSDNAPPLHWPLAIITEIYPGADGIVRNVQVKTKGGYFIRPVVKVCPLPNQ